jgi:organic hydroperoxide reductase OsmC/OhrA
MSDRTHLFRVTTTWTGNAGEGTRAANAYDRAYTSAIAGKPTLYGSSGTAVRSDPSRHNPEDLLVASVSACHMLWYLAIAAKRKIVVTSYVDRAEGTMTEARNGSGRMTSVILAPRIVLAPGTDVTAADALHEEAHEMCYVAQSVNFPITVEAHYEVGE